MKPKRLLIVDDTPSICALIRAVAEDLDYEVHAIDDPGEFEAAYHRTQPTFITLDLAMPTGDGVELLRYLAEQGCTARIAVISGFDSKVVNSALRLGQNHDLNMVGALRKPFAVDELEDMLAVQPEGEFLPTAEDLRAAIEQGHVVPYFQPKVELDAKKGDVIQGAEALARWEHPDYGLIQPSVFIPLAEAEGLISALTWSILEQSVRHLARWRDGGLLITVSVNITAGLLVELDYPDRIATLVRDCGGEPGWFVLEITESGAMEDAGRAMDILTRLRLKGFHLSCDDFGTGYSSLVQLYRMPFGELKIDRSFVADAVAHQEARTIIRTIVDLAHNLGLTVCAEGVETRDVLEFLRAEGCDRVQGYLLGRPTPGEDFGNLVESLTHETLSKMNWSA
ncbi:MAG: EAL domain-containing response regulator [Hyphomicrobiales bacterium]|nr:EAL domain-containing response regulator [Hyphomicrobiales bacterium]